MALENGEWAKLRASKQVKGGSRTRLMVGAMVVTGLVFLPAAPVFLLTRGHSSTVIKSTEITARIDGDVSIPTGQLQHWPTKSSALAEMLDYLPPRVFNKEGREGDMVNLAFVGQQEELQEAFKRAGWVKTDKWTPLFVWHLLQHGTGDTKLPMARFFLFGRVQDYAYAMPDPDGGVSRRHHLRIWKTNFTADGKPVWVGAATHDVAIEIAKGGRLINHRIDPEVDQERDFVGESLTQTSSVRDQEYVSGGYPVFQGETASGQAYYSDSRILLLNLQQIMSAKKGESDQTSVSVRETSPPRPQPAESFLSDVTMPR